MKKSLMAVIAVFVMLAVAIPMTSCSYGEDVEVNDNEWHFVGEMKHDGVSKESPSNVTIKIKDSNDVQISENFSSKLASDGTFDVKLKAGKSFEIGSTYHVSIEEYGYVIVSCPSEMTVEEGGWFSFVPSDKQISDKTLTITSPGHYIVMGSSISSLSGKVISSLGDKTPLNGVKITLTNPETKESRVTFTQNDGTYKFNDLKAGEYKLVAESKRFQQYTSADVIKIDPTIENVYNLELTPTGEIDAAHWMTILGGALSVIVLCAVVGHVIKQKKKRA